MTEESEAKGAPHPHADEGAQGQDVLGLGEPGRDELLDWVGEHLTLVRQSASGQRPQYWIFAVGFVLGLATHVGGFLLRSATTEPLLLLADLLYALGFALWTGVVVAMFVDVWPDIKKRQFKEALDAYQAAIGERARAGRGKTPDQAGAKMSRP